MAYIPSLVVLATTLFYFAMSHADHDYEYGKMPVSDSIMLDEESMAPQDESIVLQDESTVE